MADETNPVVAAKDNSLDMHIFQRKWVKILVTNLCDSLIVNHCRPDEYAIAHQVSSHKLLAFIAALGVFAPYHRLECENLIARDDVTL